MTLLDSVSCHVLVMKTESVAVVKAEVVVLLHITELDINIGMACFCKDNGRTEY